MPEGRSMIKQFRSQIALTFTYVLLVASSVFAGPAPVQTYYLSVQEDNALTVMQNISPASCGAGAPVNPVSTYASFIVGADNAVVYIDHWEDGFEADVANSLQASTQIWGDGDLTNGVAPGFGADLLNRGDVVIINNDINTLTYDTLLDSSGAPEIADGGDMIAASVPIALTRVAWANGSNTLLAGAVEQLPTSVWGTDFTVPAGEDTASNEAFQYTGASIMAQEDGTLINIDTDGDI